MKATSRSSRQASGPTSAGSAKFPPARRFGTDDLAGHTEHVLGELVGDDDPLAGGLGEVPRVDQELDRQDAEGSPGGHLVRADLDLAVEPADVPGLERGLSRRGDPALQRAGRGLGTGARRGTEIRDRSDQVLGQLGYVELGAHRGLMVIGLVDAPQDQLAGGQRGLGGAERIKGGRRRPLVGSGVTGGGGGDEAVKIVRPARGVAGLLLAGQPLVHQVHHGPAGGGLQRDDNGRGARRQIHRALPTPGEHDAAARLHLGEGARHGSARG